MPRYYLHVCNGTGFVEDEEGVELPGVDAARRQAIDGLRDIMAAEMRRGEVNMASFIEIEDEDRRLVSTVSFADAIHITSDQGSGRPGRTRLA